MKKRVMTRKKLFHSKKKLKKLDIIIILTIFVTIFVSFVLQFMDSKFRPILLSYAELETRKFSTIIVNKAITMEMTNQLDTEKLFIITKNDEGKIEAIDFNTVVVNKILNEATASAVQSLKNLERGNVEQLDIDESDLINHDEKDLRKGIFYKIPLGAVFNNSFLANLGPKIPVRLSFIGDMMCNLENKVTNYGINSALIETNIHLEIKIKVIMPFITNTINVLMDTPISLKLISGSVPNYYLNGYNQNTPSLNVPME